jgi:hypothetical protein
VLVLLMRGFLKYAVEMTSSGIIYIASLTTIGSGH